jgi:DNA-binding NarL/FixJ family response regulator
VRVLIIEDHALFSESLALALSIEGYDVRCVPLPASRGLGHLLGSATPLYPRIALLDLDLGPLVDGVQLITPLVRAGIHVVVVTGSIDKARWGESLRYGARTVLAKTQPLNDILATVRRINQGLPVMDHVEREQLIQLWREQREKLQILRDRLELLTPRERDVLGQLMKGHQVREIAHESVVSEATVRTQVKSILAKLEVCSQLGAVGLAHELGWSPFAAAG